MTPLEFLYMTMAIAIWLWIVLSILIFYRINSVLKNIERTTKEMPVKVADWFFKMIIRFLGGGGRNGR